MMSTSSSHLADQQVNQATEIIAVFRIISVSKIAHKAYHSKVFLRFTANNYTKKPIFTV